MTYETEYGNMIHKTDAVSDLIGPALVQGVTMLPIVRSEDIPEGTMIKKFAKDGYLTADTLEEATALSYGSGHELTQSSVSATVVKYVGAAKLTVEAEQFTRMTVPAMAMKVGNAIGRNIDSDIKALASGFSNTVTADSTVTLDDLMLAELDIRNNTYNVSNGPLIFSCNNSAAYALKKEIVQSSAAVFTQQNKASLLDGNPSPQGYLGSVINYDIYQTTGMPTSGSDDVNLLFDPMLAINGVMRAAVNTNVVFKGSEGFYTEITGYVWADFIEYYDEAGVGVLSDTAS